MIEVRDGMKACENLHLGMDDVQFIIDEICINWMF